MARGTLDDLAALVADYEARRATSSAASPRELAMRAANHAMRVAMASGEPAKIESAIRSLRAACEFTEPRTEAGESSAVVVLEAAVGADPDADRE